MAGVTLDNVQKSYGRVAVIPGLDLQIHDGEFCVFVGPSGCGKSTLLRMIAGLEETTGGGVSIGGASMAGVGPADRGIAMVFQTYALYPHKTVAGNMGFALKHARRPKAEINQKVQAGAEILNLTPLLNRLPKELSGGQRQRVAIGRAIVREPGVFLFDEPLSNLDAALRGQMRVEILALHQRLKSTMIYVTHDQVEAMTLADRIVVMNTGRIEQVGTPMELYDSPASLFVAEFIGAPKMNILDGVWTPEGVDIGGSVVGAALSSAPAPGAPVKLGLRPESLTTADPSEAVLRGTVRLTERLGATTLTHVELDSGPQIVASLEGRACPRVGESLGLALANNALAHVFDPSGRALSRW